MHAIATLLSRLDAAPGLTLRRTTPVDSEELHAAIRPHYGELRWTAPPSFRAVLATHGAFSATRLVPALDCEVGFSLLGPDAIGSANEDLVHMPERVSRDPGVYLTTNHLVGFASSGHEAMWCFDVTCADTDGEYPIYYHHQDEPRARLVATGAWENPEDREPDFVSFAQWLEVMTAALTAPEPPPWFENLGQPGMTFVHQRRTLA